MMLRMPRHTCMNLTFSDGFGLRVSIVINGTKTSNWPVERWKMKPSPVGTQNQSQGEASSWVPWTKIHKDPWIEKLMSSSPPIFHSCRSLVSLSATRLFPGASHAGRHPYLGWTQNQYVWVSQILIGSIQSLWPEYANGIVCVSSSHWP